MAKVLSISSQVVHGHVGNSTAAFVFQRMGHPILAVPTIILSNRPGYKALAGERIDPGKLDQILEALLSNGWLASVDAFASGYLPSPGHVELCARWVARVKSVRPETVYLCDPILGDEPAGFYIDEAAAIALRDLLVPLADVLTPNAFELGWLSGQPIADEVTAVSAAQSLSRPAVVVTSAPAGSPRLLANILVEGGEAVAAVMPRRKVLAHGTGDFFASAFLGYKLNRLSNRSALAAASGAIDLILDKSEGRTELALIETQESWARADSLLVPLTTLPRASATS
jgi:pyridoxine kinase